MIEIVGPEGVPIFNKYILESRDETYYRPH